MAARVSVALTEQRIGRLGQSIWEFLLMITSSLRITFIALFALSSASCGLGRVTKVDEHAYGGSYVEAKATVAELVDKCWTLRSKNILRDRVFGKIEEKEAEYSITIGRHNFDFPFVPFARIIVRDVSGDVIIDVEEEELSLGKRYDVAKSVTNWLSGDTACQPLESR